MSTQDNNKIQESTLEQIAEVREHLESIENISHETKELANQKLEKIEKTNKILQELTEEVKKKEEFEVSISSEDRKRLKGDKGEKGDIGASGQRGLIGIGKPGKPGKDAKPPTKTELKKIIKPLIPDPIPGKDGADGSPDTPIEIRDKLETLDGNYRLDAKAIKNLPLVGVAYNERRGGTKGHTIQDEGVNLSARTNLNFVGAGVTVTDDAANNQTDVTIPAGVTDHGALTGLADDDHAQYALLAGRAGGQTLIGGTASGDNLTLQSTSHATKGKILFGTSAYDEVNDRLLIGNTTGTNDLHIEKNVNSAVNLYVLNPSTGVNSQVQMLFGIAGTGGQYCWVAHRGTNKTASGILVANSSSFVGADINGTILGSINSGGGASTSFVAGGYDASNECMRIRSNGNISISGKSGSPFLSGAYLHFAPGTAAVNSAPLRFRSGTLLTTAEVGAIEFLTDKFYATITTGAARKELTLNDVALTSGRVPFATTNGRITDDADFTFATDTLTVTKIAATTLTGLQTYADAVNMTFNATTGTKIGTATTQKLAFYNATPIVQPTGIIDADGTLADITTKFNALLAKLEALGLQAVA